MGAVGEGKEIHGEWLRRGRYKGEISRGRRTSGEGRGWRYEGAGIVQTYRHT